MGWRVEEFGESRLKEDREGDGAKTTSCSGSCNPEGKSVGCSELLYAHVLFPVRSPVMKVGSLGCVRLGGRPDY
jgi:hypothetical protein